MLCLFISPNTSPGNQCSFTVWLVLSVPQCPIVVIMQRAAFWHWLLPLSDVKLRFLHVFLLPDNSLIFVLNNSSLAEWTTMYPFTYWRTPWLLPSFGDYEQAAINTHVQLFEWAQVCSRSGKYQEAQLLDHMERERLVLSGWETSKLSSQVAAPFCIPSSNDWAFLPLHIPTRTWCSQYFGFWSFY